MCKKVLAIRELCEKDLLEKKKRKIAKRIHWAVMKVQK